MMAHLQSLRPSLTKTAKQAIPNHLEAVMAKLLEKNPNDRFDTISDVGRAMFDARATNVFGSKPVVIGAVVVLVLGIAAVLGMSGRVIPNKVALHPGKGTAKLEFLERDAWNVWTMYR